MILRLLTLTLLIGCTDAPQKKQIQETPFQVDTPPKLIADGFDYPVGIPDGEGYYNAQSFGKNTHLGDDWNGLGGGNSDLGDPVYNVAHGVVVYADDNGPGWGNVVRIVHYLPDNTKVESLYAHFDTTMVSQGEWIKKGVQIGTIGTADGAYPAHLHFEMRDSLSLSIGGGYSRNTAGYINPAKFIENHRK